MPSGYEDTLATGVQAQALALVVPARVSPYATVCHGFTDGVLSPKVIPSASIIIMTSRVPFWFHLVPHSETELHLARYPPVSQVSLCWVGSQICSRQAMSVLRITIYALFAKCKFEAQISAVQRGYHNAFILNLCTTCLVQNTAWKRLKKTVS
jgi:hypothetical protein